MEQTTSKKSSDVLLAAVTLGVIGVVLIFFLFSTPYSTRDMARKSACMTKMREIGLAYQMYVNDYGGVLPSSVGRRCSERRFRTVRGQLPPPASPKYVPKTYAEAIYPHRKNEELFFCPSDPVGYVHRKFLWWESFTYKNPGPKTKVSYVLKKAINDAWIDPKIKARRETDYNYPSEQVLFYEHRSFHWGGDPICPNGKVGRSFNVCYFDSHVKTVRLQEPKIEPDYYNWDPEAAKIMAKRQIDPRKYCDKLQ